MAVAYALGMIAWGEIIAPFNRFNTHHGRSLVLGGAALVVALPLLRGDWREAWHRRFEARPSWLLVVVAVSVALLWTDGGWRSSFYLASFAAILFAAVVAGVRWSIACGVLLALGYVVGLGVNGYTWTRLNELKDADSVVANTGGYLIAALAFSFPVAWLRRHLADVDSQMAGVVATIADARREGAADREGATRSLVPSLGSARHAAPDRTEGLTPRQLEVVRWLALSLRTVEIADKLGIGRKAVQNHIDAAKRTTGAKDRTDLVLLALREGRVDISPDDPGQNT